jgi:Acyl-CoA synthetase (NDP forming)
MSDGAGERPPGYPPAWEEDAVLKDGGTIRVRPILPADREALQEMVRGLSRESVYFRFFQVKRELTAAELDHFTRLDYDRRMAFVALLGSRIVGVGRYMVTVEDPAVAEVAFAVSDDQQNRGIGTLLLNRITAYARTRGIRAFRAHVLADNRGMMRVFRNAGFAMRRELDEGVYTVEFPTEESEATREAVDRYHRRSVTASLMPLFYPHSIAVIGASRDPGSIGGRLFTNLIAGDFAGPVYPVNPTTPVVRSVAAYRSVLDIPDSVDLAFVVVPARHVVSVAEECARKGVKGLVVITAGFGETGPAGRREEERLLRVVRDAGMRMIGPNCMGLVNTDPAVRLDGQFGPVRAPRGNVAISSQSGALGLSILANARRSSIGISSFVSVGNNVDVSGDDLLVYWEGDPATDVILLYLESFGSPRRFARAARRVATRKPIVAVKSGRTKAGARAASSHTGSLASLDVAVDALFRQAGVTRVDTLEGLFDVSALLANQPLPAGRRVAVVTNAGGPGILAVDALVSRGLEVPEFGPELQAELRSLLSPDAAVRNPVDMIASAGPDQYRAVLDRLLTADEVDTVIAIFIPASPRGVAETVAAIGDAAAQHHGEKTFLTVYMHPDGVAPATAGARAIVPTYPFPERAANALVAAVERAEWLARPRGEPVTFGDVDRERAGAVVAGALARRGGGGGWLEPAEVDGVLAAYGIRVPFSTVVHDEDAAVAAAASVGGPVVLKVVAPSAVHKSDVGGVALDLRDGGEVREAYRRVSAAVPDAEGVLVQEFVEGGHEVLIGTTEDPNFGPLVGFGLGGIFVELIGDVAFRIPPLTDVDVREMIGEVRSARLLEGYRGGPPGDVDAVAETLLRVSAMVEDLPEIAEMDLNPVLVGPPGAGVTVVDARIRVVPREPGLADVAADLVGSLGETPGTMPE